MKPEKWSAIAGMFVAAECLRPDPRSETERLSLPVLIRPADLIAMLADFADLQAALLSRVAGDTLSLNRAYLEESARSLAAARGYLPPVLVITA